MPRIQSDTFWGLITFRFLDLPSCNLYVGSTSFSTISLFDFLTFFLSLVSCILFLDSCLLLIVYWFLLSDNCSLFLSLLLLDFPTLRPLDFYLFTFGLSYSSTFRLLYFLLFTFQLLNPIFYTFILTNGLEL